MTLLIFLLLQVWLCLSEEITTASKIKRGLPEQSFYASPADAYQPAASTYQHQNPQQHVQQYRTAPEYETQATNVASHLIYQQPHQYGASPAYQQQNAFPTASPAFHPLPAATSLLTQPLYQQSPGLSTSFQPPPQTVTASYQVANQYATPRATNLSPYYSPLYQQPANHYLNNGYQLTAQYSSPQTHFTPGFIASPPGQHSTVITHPPAPKLVQPVGSVGTSGKYVLVNGRLVYQQPSYHTPTYRTAYYQTPKPQVKLTPPATKPQVYYNFQPLVPKTYTSSTPEPPKVVEKPEEESEKEEVKEEEEDNDDDERSDYKRDEEDDDDDNNTYRPSRYYSSYGRHDDDDERDSYRHHDDDRFEEEENHPKPVSVKHSKKPKKSYEQKFSKLKVVEKQFAVPKSYKKNSKPFKPSYEDKYNQFKAEKLHRPSEEVEGLSSNNEPVVYDKKKSFTEKWLLTASSETRN